MEAKLHEITLAAGICERIRQIYHPNEQWGECHGDITRRLNQFLGIARKFYCDKTELEMLKELARYSTDDIKEAFENGNGYQGINDKGHAETAGRQADNDTGHGDTKATP